MNDQPLWRLAADARSGAVFECVMVSCCSGAELQVRRLAPGEAEAEIVLRELYPTKSDLFERARTLEREYATPSGPAEPRPIR